MRARILLGFGVCLFVVFGFCFAKWSVDFSQWDSFERGFMLASATFLSLFVAANPFMNDD